MKERRPAERAVRRRAIAWAANGLEKLACLRASTGRRLLLVEDDRATHNALRAIFARRGWQVLLATTIAEALPQLDATPPDCMILDLMLPDGDGTSILQHVAAAGLPTRVVVTTGSNDPARLAAVAKLNPLALLRKPIDLSALLHHLDPPAPPPPA